MKLISWSPKKAILLRNNKARNNIGFEDCLLAIQEGRVLKDEPNPSAKFPHQRIFVLNVENYAYVVPYVEDEEVIFLKTIFPSRKYTAKYLRT
jgi:hypothetical protein